MLNNSRVHLYCGSKEVLTKVILMDRDALSAGESTYVQFRLEEPIAVRRGDRFIIRFYSPIITIGGGQILDAVPEKHKRNRENVMEGFRMLESGNISDIFVLKTGGHKFYSKELLLQELGMLPEIGNREIEGCIEEGKLVELEDGTILAASKFQMMTDRLTPGRRLHSGNDCRPAKRAGGEAGGHDPRFPGRGHLGDGTVR